MSNPDDYGPGKPVSAEMMEEFMRENAHKLLLCLMLRYNLRSTLIDESDLDRLMDLESGSAIVAQSTPTGIKLDIVSPTVATAIGAR